MLIARRRSAVSRVHDARPTDDETDSLGHARVRPGHALLAPALAAEDAEVRGGVELRLRLVRRARGSGRRGCDQGTRGGLREELAPRLVHGWYAGALLLESWYTSALLLESTQLLEICNPHSNEAEMTHSSNECSGRYSCTGPLPPSLQACNRSLCSILQPWARVFQIDWAAICSYLCSNRVHISAYSIQSHC